MYLADPGGVFASDTHRRVLGSLFKVGPSWPVEDLMARINNDQHTKVDDTEELSEVLKDLEADGYVSEKQDGWGMTAAGLKALNADPTEE
jgi:hypothetical protein